eukprot:3558310-Prymnesium_polylepis.1
MTCGSRHIIIVPACPQARDHIDCQQQQLRQILNETSRRTSEVDCVRSCAAVSPHVSRRSAQGPAATRGLCVGQQLLVLRHELLRPRGLARHARQARIAQLVAVAQHAAGPATDEEQPEQHHE